MGISFAFKVPPPSVLLLPFVVPMSSVSVLRLHDAGTSGWRVLIALIPAVGPIACLVGMMMDSIPDANQYGPSPEAVGHPVG